MRTAILFAAMILASPAYAADCYRWQALTCEGETAVIRDKHRNVIGYVDSDGRILDKHRNVKGYITPSGAVLRKDRRESLKIEGMPERYSPVLE